MAEAKPPKRPRGRRAPPQAELRTLVDLRQVRALADPLRMRILGALGEERTTKQVAELLKEKPTRLYHHVAALERAGLVRLARTRPKRGTVEKYYRSVARSFEARVSTATHSDASIEAIDALIGTAFATTSSELRGLLDRGAGKELEEEGLLAFVEVHGTKAEIDATRRRLQKALEALKGESKGAGPVQRYRLTLAFYPLDTGETAPPRRAAKRRRS